MLSYKPKSKLTKMDIINSQLTSWNFGTAQYKNTLLTMWRILKTFLIFLSCRYFRFLSCDMGIPITTGRILIREKSVYSLSRSCLYFQMRFNNRSYDHQTIIDNTHKLVHKKYQYLRRKRVDPFICSYHPTRKAFSISAVKYVHLVKRSWQSL